MLYVDNGVHRVELPRLGAGSALEQHDFPRITVLSSPGRRQGISSHGTKAH